MCIRDSIFHLSVLLAERGIAWDDIAAELNRRHGTSGIAEKASRKG
jgi:phosphoribosyl-ATP pyrophosphohydrolase